MSFIVIATGKTHAQSIRINLPNQIFGIETGHIMHMSRSILLSVTSASLESGMSMHDLQFKISLYAVSYLTQAVLAPVSLCEQTT